MTIRVDLILCLVAIACVGVSPAAGLEGAWEGFVSITPARLQLIQAHFEPAESGWRGTIDVPGATGLPLKQVSLETDHVRLEVDIEGQSIAFNGVLRNGALTGVMTLAGDEYAFSLHPLPDSGEPANRVEAWNQDLDHVVDRFLRYDRSFRSVTRRRFSEDIVKLRKSLGSKSDAEVIVALSRAVALSGNAHTRLYLLRNRTALRRLPIRAHWFSDGLFIVEATDDHADTVGCRVTSIADTDPRKLKRRVASLFAGNSSWLDYKSPFFMTSPEVLAGLGVIRTMDRVALRFACPDGTASVRSLEPLPLEPRDNPTEPWWDLTATFRDDPDGAPAPLYLRFSDQHYRFDYLEQQQTVYFRYNRAKNMAKGESFDEFSERLLEFVRTHEPERFVVDLRFNTGGDNTIAAEFIEQLAQLEKDGSLGRLYVLIGRATFSAGISHAAALRRHTNATFIGEPVGDELDTWSEGGNIVLPNSQLTVHFTNGFHSLSNLERPELEQYYWTDLDLDPDSLEPDVAVPLSSTEFFAGLDPVLDAVFNHGR